MSRKIVVPVVLVLVATLGAFFAINSQLTSLQSNLAQSQGLGSVSIQFASTGLDPASQGQGNGQGHTTTGAITNVVIRSTMVEIHAANSTGNDGWTTLNVPETIIDFTQSTSVSTIINGASLPAGKYNQIRLFADHVTVSIRSGENLVQRTLNIPSGKIEVPITPGGFDLAQSGTVNVTLTFTFNAKELAHNPKNMTPVVKTQVA